jgi:hypothetical protein
MSLLDRLPSSGERRSLAASTKKKQQYASASTTRAGWGEATNVQLKNYLS